MSESGLKTETFALIGSTGLKRQDIFAKGQHGDAFHVLGMI